ncbi:MAG TPA: TAXI family TRAP transporter solute-binding subunit [Solirubrobacteraceae bacterium]|nr:TAXI family TRAP transporter solute-binding subunit [Solirubrobacteraceae bacterium]
MTKPVEFRILTAGRNWLNIGSALAIGLNGYYSPLGPGSSVTVTTFDPGAACMEGPRLVADGKFDVCMTTPQWYVDMARRGAGRFDAPLPIRALAVFPHDDLLGIAVRAETGITSIRDIVDNKIPIKLSTPSREMHHPGGYAADVVMEQYGFSREDIVSWGGTILEDRPRNQNDPKSVPIDPSFDMLIDEAIVAPRWKKVAEAYDLRFLPIEDEILERLGEMGMPTRAIAKDRLKGVDADIKTIDFEGWILCCSEDLSDELGYLVAQALDQECEAINARFGPKSGMSSPMDMNKIGRNTPVPLNPGAEAYYREHGYL